ncbi:hypothetical protein BMS3Abin17_00182 [archaeon BMS3Abin17]|nr:hypothetical protein BMS3Abin17_00182 [archaeon BMS3Abin17]HDZ60459.1 hypothetical protein [Candidatus Pacearchaeota archaeon]
MKEGLLVLCIFIVLTLNICFINAGHVVTNTTSGTSYSANESVIFTYNITVNNTDTGSSANITQVNITLPNLIKFVANTGGTGSGGSFSNTSNVLTWNGDGTVMNLSSQNFWFNANSSTADSYTITVTTLNSTGTQSTNLNVEILLVASNCTEDWNCTWADCISGEQTGNCTDLNSCGTTNNQPNETRSCIESCTPNWNCTDYSNCIGGVQIRVCVDTNSCGNDTSKPIENQTCTSACTPEWKCTNWVPEKCPKNETQTRKCTDKNECGTTIGKSKEEQSCAYDGSTTWIYALIIGLVAIIVIIVGFIIFKFIKKPDDEFRGTGSQGYQQFPPSPPPRTYPQMPPQRPAIIQRPNYPPPTGLRINYSFNS